jgi:uncharacterized protein
MSNDSHGSTLGGGFTYFMIPATDVHESGRFFEAVFGWRTSGGDHHLGFASPDHSIRGAFETGLKVSDDSGVIPYIFVSEIDGTLERISQHGGTVVRPRYDEGDIWVATFRDVAGNLLGVWQMQPA